MARLTTRQQRFVEEYIFDFNATKAAIRAGYSPKYANREGARLVVKSRLQEAIDAALKEMRDKSLATAYEVEAYLTAVMRGQTMSEIIVIEGMGEGMSAARRISKAPDEKERLKAAEILAKRHGLTDTKLQLTHLTPPTFHGESELE